GAHTVGYTAALAALALLAAEVTGADAGRRALGAIPDLLAFLLGQESWDDLGARLAGRRRFWFVGGGPNAATAREGALKLSETAWLPAVAFEPESFLHGPSAALEAGDALVLIAPPAPARAPRCPPDPAADAARSPAGHALPDHGTADVLDRGVSGAAARAGTRRGAGGLAARGRRRRLRPRADARGPAGGTADDAPRPPRADRGARGRPRGHGVSRPRRLLRLARAGTRADGGRPHPRDAGRADDDPPRARRAPARLRAERARVQRDARDPRRRDAGGRAAGRARVADGVPRRVLADPRRPRRPEGVARAAPGRRRRPAVVRAQCRGRRGQSQSRRPRGLGPRLCRRRRRRARLRDARAVRHPRARQPRVRPRALGHRAPADARPAVRHRRAAAGRRPRRPARNRARARRRVADLRGGDGHDRPRAASARRGRLRRLRAQHGGLDAAGGTAARGHPRLAGRVADGALPRVRRRRGVRGPVRERAPGRRPRARAPGHAIGGVADGRRRPAGPAGAPLKRISAYWRPLRCAVRAPALPAQSGSGGGIGGGRPGPLRVASAR